MPEIGLEILKKFGMGLGEPHPMAGVEHSHNSTHTYTNLDKKYTHSHKMPELSLEILEKFGMALGEPHPMGGVEHT